MMICLYNAVPRKTTQFLSQSMWKSMTVFLIHVKAVRIKIELLVSTIPKKEGAGGMPIEHLPSIHQALSSNPK
jgi:hypothetical protein